MAQLEALTVQLSSTTAGAPRETAIARGESSRLALPEKFNGSADRCRGFLRQCEVFFSHQPGMYREDGTKCAFLLSLLTGKAFEWASAVWDADPLIRASYSHFEGFRNPSGTVGVERRGALGHVLCRLKPLALQTELACHVEATSLTQFVATAIRLDNLRRQRRPGGLRHSLRPSLRQIGLPGGVRNPPKKTSTPWTSEAVL
ncbi:hypothetical protein QTP70_027654 [Hemibagrus guttatus]|uniref:DUF4939 domain-containing protein n=1 Tax=Hemibagrus guttatus TaxID=175788 RepID=A0AAE0ULU8_9TELE|nr:hypothetical protein QTP70_027654 [Hemibagrus guttatus]